MYVKAMATFIMFYRKRSVNLWAILREAIAYQYIDNKALFVYNAPRIVAC